MENVLKSPQALKKARTFADFLADTRGHTPTSPKIYANVRGNPHMSAAYARPVANIAGTGIGHLGSQIKTKTWWMVLGPHRGLELLNYYSF